MNFLLLLIIEFIEKVTLKYSRQGHVWWCFHQFIHWVMDKILWSRTALLETLHPWLVTAKANRALSREFQLSIPSLSTTIFTS